MTPQEFFTRAQTVWGAFDGDPVELLAIWRTALVDVKPQNLQLAFDWLVKNSKFRPKPADVFTAIEKMGMSTAAPKNEGVKYGLMLDYADARRGELMGDWRRKNADLWHEAETEGWDSLWLVEARKRAHELAQVEYVAKNHGWPKETAALFEIVPEEIAGRDEVQLFFTDAQIEGMRIWHLNAGRHKPAPQPHKSIKAMTDEEFKADTMAMLDRMREAEPEYLARLKKANDYVLKLKARRNA